MVSELILLPHSLLLEILLVESQIQEQLDAVKESDLGEVVSFTMCAKFVTFTVYVFQNLTNLAPKKVDWYANSCDLEL